jgi:hypothetical protein
MRIRENKNSDENFTSLLSAIDRQAAAPDQEFLKQLRERSAREFAAGAPDVSTNTPKSIHIAGLRSIIMKSPITKLATAAIVAIACLIGLSLWRGTESGIALADVLARIEQVKAYRSKSSLQRWSEKVTGEDPNKPYNFEETHGTSLDSREYGSKSTWEQLDPNGGESTFDESYALPQKRTWIFIDSKRKEYRRTEFDDVFAEQWQYSGPHKLLKEILKTKYESLGRSTMDGIEVAGFRTTDPNSVFGSNQNFGQSKRQVDQKLWVDVKTRLPVRCDTTWVEFYQMENKKKCGHDVAYDFQWDVPVDAADFEPVIPDGYASWVVKYPAHITEETAIQGLKLLVELLGKYLENITDVDDTVLWLVKEKEIETPAAMRLKEEIKGLTDEEINNKLVDFLMPIRGLRRFYAFLQYNTKDRAYYGKTVTPKDTDKVLMRWKVSDSEYRVIYGDLHAETVTKEKLAELEAALPK